MAGTNEIDFSSEDWGRPTPIFENCWVVAERHSPGFNKTFGELNNRTFAFRLKNKEGREVLVVLGCGGPPALAAAKELEKDTGLLVEWVVGNGGAHHLFLDLWYEAFPEARVLIPSKRVPNTRNGKELAAKYEKRWELMHGPRPTQLVEEFGDQIDVVIFDQLHGFSDETNASVMGGPKDHTSEPPKRGGFSTIMKMGGQMKDMSQPTDEVTFFHKKSGLVIGGHNFQFIYVPKGHAPSKEHRLQSAGFPLNVAMSMMMPKGQFVSNLEGMPCPIADPERHIEEWNLVLDWDIQAWTTAHNPPTVCGPALSPDELKTAIRESLHRSGEDDPTGQRLKWNKKNGKK